MLLNEGPQGLRFVDAGVVHQHDDLALEVPEEMSAEGHYLRASDGS